MTFDEQLRRAFETVTGRLRDDIARHAETAIEELAEAAEADRAHAVADAREVAQRAADARVNAAVAAAEADARRAAERETAARVGAAVSASEERARESVKEEARRAGEVARLVGIAEGRRQAEQESGEKVDAALTAARAEWRSAERAASERLLRGVRSIEAARSLSEILDALVTSAGREASRAAVLLLARGARFRGWRFVGFGSPLGETSAIEFGADESGVIREAARTGAAVSSPRGGAPAFAELPADCACFAFPITLGGQVVAVLYGDQGSTSPASRDSLSVWPHTLEVLARRAAGCLETQTALKAAGLWSNRPAPQDLPPGSAGASGDPSEDDLAARRYARLHVSEIKLYHEADVMAGRRDRNLAKRLGGEIARARVLYDQRVAPHVRESVDYFHAELIQTLANGDETLLELGT
jgi:hypothetical protein